MQLQLHYTNYTTPQLQHHYTTTTTAAALHHTTSSSCGRGDRPNDHCNHCSHSKKTQVQPPFSPSVDSLCHPWFTTTKLSYRFPVLKLPPPPCAVLLVDSISAAVCISGLTWFPFWKKKQNFWGHQDPLPTFKWIWMQRPKGQKLLQLVKALIDCWQLLGMHLGRNAAWVPTFTALHIWCRIPWC